MNPLAVYFLFVLGVTQPPFFTSMTLLFIIIVSTTLFICFAPVQTTFALFSQIGRGPRQRSLLPFLRSSGPSPLASQGPALCLEPHQTRCGFLLLFLFLPLIYQGLQGVEGEERLSTHILPPPPTPASLPSSKAQAKGKQAVQDRTSV